MIFRVGKQPPFFFFSLLKVWTFREEGKKRRGTHVLRFKSPRDTAHGGTHLRATTPPFAVPSWLVCSTNWVIITDRTDTYW